MQLHVGLEMTCRCVQPTPMTLALSIHPSRAAELVRPEQFVTDPAVATAGYLDLFGDRWYTFDARNNVPRIGRLLIARGRDACDVALSSTFGANELEGFRVWTDVVAAA